VRLRKNARSGASEPPPSPIDDGDGREYGSRPVDGAGRAGRRSQDVQFEADDEPHYDEKDEHLAVARQSDRERCAFQAEKPYQKRKRSTRPAKNPQMPAAAVEAVPDLNPVLTSSSCLLHPWCARSRRRSHLPKPFARPIASTFSRRGRVQLGNGSVA
jgi:hypothetical protein